MAFTAVSLVSGIVFFLNSILCSTTSIFFVFPYVCYFIFNTFIYRVNGGKFNMHLNYT